MTVQGLEGSQCSVNTGRKDEIGTMLGQATWALGRYRFVSLTETWAVHSSG